MDVLSALGLSLPAGLNAYIPLLAAAVAHRLGWLELREPFSVMGEWWVIAIISVLLIVEVLADKFPAVDSVNDAIQTFVRPAAGGILALGVSGQAGERFPVVMVIAGILLAGGVHAVKASARPAVNVATAGAGAPVASVIEDAVALVAAVIAIAVPVLVVGVLAIAGFAAWRLLARRPAARGT